MAWVHLISSVLAVILLIQMLHTVDEGYVGVYHRGGALLNYTTEPGFHLKLPFITSFEQVQITVQTDKVTNIPCGTSGGVMITFDKIEVVNRLKRDYVLETIHKYGIHYDHIWIFDKIHHEINQFCSKSTLREVYIDHFDTLDDMLVEALQRDCDKWAPGIEIIATRVTKPVVPSTIRRNYELMEAEKTKLLIATEKQKVIELEAEIERMRATIAAQKVSDVSRITSEREVAEMKALSKIQAIEDEIMIKKRQSLSDISLYNNKKLAEGNQLKLTDTYLRQSVIESLKSRPKTIFSSKLEEIFPFIPFNFNSNSKNELCDSNVYK